MFAKLFETEYGQVVVMKQEDDSEEMEIRFYVQPEGANTCSMAFSGYSSEESHTVAFDSVNIEMATRAAQEICGYF